MRLPLQVFSGCAGGVPSTSEIMLENHRSLA